MIVENRHQPTAVHLRTYVEGRYKITVYQDHDYGELFDLQEDPGEHDNRWNAPAYPCSGGCLAGVVPAARRRLPSRWTSCRPSWNC